MVPTYIPLLPLFFLIIALSSPHITIPLVFVVALESPSSFAIARHSRLSSFVAVPYS